VLFSCQHPSYSTSLRLLLCVFVLPASHRYVGFDMIANGAEEAKNPKRDIPLATALCLGLCTCSLRRSIYRHCG